MSQSPLQETLSPGQQYLDSWVDLATRIRQGNSFSGREPNCFFLNAGGKRFADASTCAGFDLTDDSRGIALADWDHDGDLDVWMSNRTGPRLRFLRNDLGSSGKSLALFLAGDPARGVNRDAIGSRVEVVTSSGRQIRTVTAGSGFVSQSTRWLYFGLGDETVESVIVRWPNGERQMLNGTEPGGRYMIRFGKSQLFPAVNRTVKALVPSDLEVPELTDAGRVWLKEPMPIPTMQFTDSGGKKVSLFKGQHRKSDQPLFVNLWAPWCQPCLAELKDLAENEEMLNGQLSILALNVEVPDAAAQKLIESKLSFPYAHGSCDEDFVSAVDDLVSQFVYRHRGVPVPFSFLIGKDDQLYAIYKGPVSAKQLAADAALLASADAEKMRNASVPFAGRWAREKFVTNPVAVASVYLEDHRFADARKYLEKKLEEEKQASVADHVKVTRIADLHFHLGRVDDAEGQLDAAIANFRKAVELNPGQMAVQTSLSDALSRAGNHDEAVPLIAQVAAALPTNLEVNMRYGEILTRAGRAAEAVAIFERGIAAEPRYPVARQRLVELLATEPSVLDLTRAVELSNELRRFAPGNADVIVSIATATAASGNKELAKEMLTSALSIANRNSDEKMSMAIREKLAKLGF